MTKEDIINANRINDRKKLSFINLNKEKESELLYKIKEIRQFVESKKPFSLGLCLFLRRFFCIKNLNKNEGNLVRMYDFAKLYIQDKLDITSYMNLISHFEKHLLITYNDIQKHSFSFMKKPNLRSKEDKKTFDLEDRVNITEDKNEKVLNNYNTQLKLAKYFITRLKNGDFGEYDEKMFDLLDIKLKKAIVDSASNLDNV